MKLSKLIASGLILLIGYTFVQYVMARREASAFVSSFKTFDNQSSIDIYDRNDKLMFTFNKKNRIPMPLNDISMKIQYSVVAVEDRTFFEHNGVSYKGLARSLKDFVLFRGLSGGSTITMQLVRTLTNNRERTLTRKFKEMIFAQELEKNYSKEEILERYLNEVYMGKNIYGMEAASKFYFGKSNMDLEAEESLFLVGILNAPERYVQDNVQARKRYLRRKQHILNRIKVYNREFYFYLEMLNADSITSPDLQENRIDGPSFNSHALEEVRRYLYSKYTFAELRGGMKVYTTFDSTMQKLGEDTIKSGLANYDKDVEGSLLAINQSTGEIYSLVGGRDFSKSEFNRAFQAKRQPGSAFKPFVYGAAFEAGFNPLTILKDTPIKIQMNKKDFYTPMNNDNDFWGPLTAWESLVYSRNVPSVKLNMMISPAKTREYAQKCGIESDVPNYPSSALGTGTVTLKEMTRSYGTIANLGMKTPKLYFINRIENRKGKILEQHEKEEVVQVLNPNKTYELTETLRGVVEKGTGKLAAIGSPVAGKTGTSNNKADAWFIGFSSNITCGVWVGRDDNKKISMMAEGGSLAAPIWAKFMNKIVDKNKKEELPLPLGVQRKNYAPPKELEDTLYQSRRKIRKELKTVKPEIVTWQ